MEKTLDSSLNQLRLGATDELLLPSKSTELNQTQSQPIADLASGKTFLSNASIESTEQTTSHSTGGSDDEEKKSKSNDGASLLPTFTNEVIVIRPEYFYENTDCQQDNKFMKNSNMQRESTN